ncbi:MAG: hypothetical protein M0Z42_02335 [Actinomycetota bacterium]|nr:hypothetical protein [Actinomycetota bacterium]
MSRPSADGEIVAVAAEIVEAHLVGFSWASRPVGGLPLPGRAAGAGSDGTGCRAGDPRRRRPRRASAWCASPATASRTMPRVAGDEPHETGEQFPVRIVPTERTGHRDRRQRLLA